MPPPRRRLATAEVGRDGFFFFLSFFPFVRGIPNAKEEDVFFSVMRMGTYTCSQAVVLYTYNTPNEQRDENLMCLDALRMNDIFVKFGKLFYLHFCDDCDDALGQAEFGECVV